MPYVGKSPADIIATAVDTTTGTFSGDLTVDTSTLVVDSANNRVGVGNASPSTILHIKGANPEYRIEDNNETGSGNIVFRDSARETAKISVASGASSTYQINMLGTPAFRIDSNNDINFFEDTGTTPKLFWDSSTERLGLGTGSPNEKLTISSGAISFLGEISTPSIGAGLFRPANNTLAVVTGSTERLRINSSGTLLWASSADLSSSVAGISFTNSTHPAINISGGSDTAFRHRMTFINGNGTVGIISTSGSATTYSTSSDYRLKENVTADWDATTRLKQLNPVRFNFIADADTTVDGFLAHEVQSVVPEAITGTHNEVDDDGNPVYQGIDQSKLVPLLVKTIQELEARIVALENA